MSRDSDNPTSLRCRSCGSSNDGAATTVDLLGKIYQVVVACAACRTSFVALSRN
ncbi:MAG: hypothetical protein IAI50_17645 [Candidatus Eremiobacteraeota bacterium]|nr:hypothetical protein [Candidatus Eremiobacteraeota bacterium]